MKKLLMSINGAELCRRIGGSILLVVAAALFALGLWLAPIAKADKPTPTATPDFNGASDPNKCTICHLPPGNPANAQTLDRKSTRLNSSHTGISYAVFCLKKKNQTRRKRWRFAGSRRP